MCFVGIGAPSAACNLARLTHAPGITLIYESGTIATKPNVLPLSIGDGELCETALTTVSVPEMFRYWLQGGRITVGFLGGAQIDRFANLNTTVVGPYDKPKVRLPGGGGAPEIATSCARDVHHHGAGQALVRRQAGFHHLARPRRRARAAARSLGVRTKGPTRVITDLCLLEPDAETKELTVTAMHPGVTREQIAGGHRLAGQVRRPGGRDCAADRAGARSAARPACPDQGGHAGQAADRTCTNAWTMRLTCTPHAIG